MKTSKAKAGRRGRGHKPGAPTFATHPLLQRIFATIRNMTFFTKTPKSQPILQQSI
jgi:hypothetical protein